MQEAPIGAFLQKRSFFLETGGRSAAGYRMAAERPPAFRNVYREVIV
jgi:hypothetical protein